MTKLALHSKIVKLFLPHRSVFKDQIELRNSGGERRRLEITRALVTNPNLILLDEPFSGVDPIAVLEVQKILQKLKRQGLSILLTDHNVRETLAVTDRAYIMHEGKILVSGSSHELVMNKKAREIYLGEKFVLV